jgi:hypothetical protein
MLASSRRCNAIVRPGSNGANQPCSARGSGNSDKRSSFRPGPIATCDFAFGEYGVPSRVRTETSSAVRRDSGRGPLAVLVAFTVQGSAGLRPAGWRWAARFRLASAGSERASRPRSLTLVVVGDPCFAASSARRTPSAVQSSDRASSAPLTIALSFALAALRA